MGELGDPTGDPVSEASGGEVKDLLKKSNKRILAEQHQVLQVVSDRPVFWTHIFVVSFFEANVGDLHFQKVTA